MFEAEEDYDQEEGLPPQDFDIIARILKAYLSTLESLNEDDTLIWKNSYTRSLGEIFAASPPMALQELRMICTDDGFYEEPNWFVSVFEAVRTGSAPLLEWL